MSRLTDEGREYYGFSGELNIQIRLENAVAYFYETPLAVDHSKDIYSTFEEAKSAAKVKLVKKLEEIQKRIQKQISTVEETPEESIIGYNPEGGW